MSSHGNLAKLPAPTMFGVLRTIAAGLRGDTTDLFELRVSQICSRALSMIRSSSQVLEKSLAIGVPISLLFLGIYQNVATLMKLTSGVQQVYGSFLCSLLIENTHRANDLVCTYLSKHGIGQDSRSLQLGSNGLYPQSNTDTVGMHYLPAVTSSAWFKLNGRWLKFTRTPANVPEAPSLEYHITLSCFSSTGNAKPIKDFLAHLRTTFETEKQAKTHILQHSSNSTRSGDSSFKPTRKLDSVSMAAAKKHEMITDMTRYLASKDWYADRGIPWRRGYHFYGPPGTGKTSISTAIAGHFHLPLVILSLPGMSEGTLQNTFSCLPGQCVVLLEDLDSAGIGQEIAQQVDTEDNAQQAAKPKPSLISLSGLLNTIDGPASHEGRILICTTNSPDSLDPALLRAGRIDMKILFGYATTEVIENLFVHIFEDATSEHSKYDVAQMAKQFAALIPENQVPPAELQNYLLQRRDDPILAIDGAEAWVQGLLASKNQGVNVASFEGQI